jgi:hypothetical protein
VTQSVASLPAVADWSEPRITVGHASGARAIATRRLPSFFELSFAALLPAGLLAGIVILAYSYSYAASHADADQTHFHLFWLGQLLFLGPALYWLMREQVPRASRLVVVIGVACFEFVPKYLRDPSYPLFHDELLHSREVTQIAASGHPFQPSPIVGIIQFFPGLHTATAALAELTGASQFAVQSLLVATLHALTLVGIFIIAEGLTGSHRVGGLAAFVYALNPSFALFDSMFAYETLAVPLFIWTVAALVKAQQTVERPQERRRWLVIAATLGCTCVVTHHLSSYELSLVVILCAIFASIRARHGVRRAEARGLWVVAISITAAAAAWFLAVASSTFGYLAPHLAAGIDQLVGLIFREQTARVLFQASTIPSYERYAAFGAPPIALAAALAGAAHILWRRRPKPSPVVGALLVLAALYFASLPLIQTAGGNEGARRTWAYTYIGIAVLAGLAADRLLGRARSSIAAFVIMAFAAVLCVGNFGAGMNQYYRFPGPYSFRSDIRTVTPELRVAAAWMLSTNGANKAILADRYSAPAMAYFAGAFPATPSAAFPTWRLYLSRRPPTSSLLYDLRTSGYDYLLVNEQTPLVPAYYHTGGASAAPGIQVPNGATATSAAVTRRYDRVPWAQKLYASTHIALYRLDLGSLARAASPHRTRRSR